MRRLIIRFAVLLVLMMTGVICLNAQTRAYFVNFNYDIDGNRTSRFISLGNDRMDYDIEADSTDIQHFTDLIDESEINIYPNPTSNSVFVNTTNPIEGNRLTAIMLSPSGILLETKEIGIDPVEFNLNDMASGIYILELRSDTDLKTWKIIKR